MRSRRRRKVTVLGHKQPAVTVAVIAVALLLSAGTPVTGQETTTEETRGVSEGAAAKTAAAKGTEAFRSAETDRLEDEIAAAEEKDEELAARIRALEADNGLVKNRDEIRKLKQEKTDNNNAWKRANADYASAKLEAIQDAPDTDLQAKVDALEALSDWTSQRATGETRLNSDVRNELRDTRQRLERQEKAEKPKEKEKAKEGGGETPPANNGGSGSPPQQNASSGGGLNSGWLLLVLLILTGVGVYQAAKRSGLGVFEDMLRRFRGEVRLRGGPPVTTSASGATGGGSGSRPPSPTKAAAGTSGAAGNARTGSEDDTVPGTGQSPPRTEAPPPTTTESPGLGAYDLPNYDEDPPEDRSSGQLDAGGGSGAGNCADCGEPLKPGKRFCTECGAKVGG